MPIRPCSVCCLLLALVYVPAAWAQTDRPAPPDSTQAEAVPEPSQAAAFQRSRVLLTSGTILVGVIEEDRADAIVLRDDEGLVTTIPRERIREVGPLLPGGLRRYDPSRTRLFFAPTARTLPRGAGRISAYYFLPSIAYGFTDWLDVSFSTIFPPSAISTVNAKVQVLRLPSVQVAVGTAALLSPGNAILSVSGDEEFGSVGTMYGMVTVGSDAGALTAGVFGGFAVGEEGTSVAPTAIGLLGLERQISDQTKLVSENYVIAVDDFAAVLSLTGVRFLGERITVDLAALLGGGPAGLGASAIPYVGVAYNFGR
ncbi:MAG: hypothetical protein AAF809_13620 [Bacteroidota bacterium]